IDGYTMGAGLELAVACDFRIATERSEFAFPEVRLGMIPGSGGSQRALRLMGMTRAKLFMMTGRRISAAEAEAWGLITQAVPNDKLDEAVGALGAELAERAPLAFAVEAERAGGVDAVWGGDSLLAKPRLESVTLLSALAGITSRVRLGVGCLATFVHRHPVLFAQQWASLDVLSRGRAWLVVCLGGPSDANAAQAAEHAVMGVRSSERVARLEEGVAILRTLF